jgi:hypothetical protein
MPSGVVFEALTDFSEKRAQYFPNLSRGGFEVIEHKGDTALVREGTGPFFTKERYDWSTKWRVWSVIEESNVVSPGGMTDIRISDRGAQWSRLDVKLDRQFVGFRGRIIQSFVFANGGSRFFKRTYIRMLKNVQRSRRKRG